MIEPIAPVATSSGTKEAAHVLLARQAAQPQKGEDQSEQQRRPEPVVRSAPAERVDVSGGLTQTYAQFVFDDQSRIMQVKIVDATTGRVVREIPPEALAELAESLRAYQAVGAEWAAAGQPRQRETPGQIGDR